MKPVLLYLLAVCGEHLHRAGGADLDLLFVGSTYRAGGADLGVASRDRALAEMDSESLTLIWKAEA